MRGDDQDAHLVEALPDPLSVQRVLADQQRLELGEGCSDGVRAEICAAPGHAFDAVVGLDASDDVGQVHDEPLGEEHGHAGINDLHRDVGDLHRVANAGSADIKVDGSWPNADELAVTRMAAFDPCLDVAVAAAGP